MRFPASLFATLVMLWVPISVGALNTENTDGTVQIVGISQSKGRMVLAKAVFLCEGLDNVSTGTCVIDLDKHGQGDFVHIFITEDNDGWVCSGVSCTVQLGLTPGCASPSVTLSTANKLDSGGAKPPSARVLGNQTVLTADGTSASFIQFGTEHAMLDRYLFADLTDVAGCTDTDVVYLTYEKIR